MILRRLTEEVSDSEASISNAPPDILQLAFEPIVIRCLYAGNDRCLHSSQRYTDRVGHQLRLANAKFTSLLEVDRSLHLTEKTVYCFERFRRFFDRIALAKQRKETFLSLWIVESMQCLSQTVLRDSNPDLAG